MIKAIEDFFHVYIATSKQKGELGAFETVMQNCQEFSQVAERLDEAMQTQI